MQDRALNADEGTELANFARIGLRVVELEADQAPATIAKAIDRFVSAHSGAGAAAAAHLEGVSDTVDLAWALGAAWGDQIVRAYGWHWALVSDDREERYGVVSPTRSLALYPAHFVQCCLEQQGIDFTGMLIFNMIEAEAYPGLAGDYYNLSLKTVRIIP